MIISLVSRKERAGKSEAARIIEESFRGVGYYSFAFNINKAAALFLGKSEGRSKYDKHPELGVSEKELNHAISERLTEIHPELPVFRVKQDIEWSLKNESMVVIDDIRRQREFVWLDEVAREHKTRHHIIEVVPVGKIDEHARMDMWSNGLEPCGYEAWKFRQRYSIENDGTEMFGVQVKDLVQRLMAQP